MFEKLVNYVLLWFAFQTPYPYIAMIGAVLLLLLFLGIFFKIQNGPAGYILFWSLVFSLAYAIGFVYREFNPPADTSLDNKTFIVQSVSASRGLKLDNREWILPAGVKGLSRRDRGYREAASALARVINNRPVTLEWVQRMNGYRILTEANTDIGSFLISQGMAKTGENASDELCRLEEDAKARRVGCWAGAFRGNPSLDCFLLAVRGITMGCIVAFGAVFIVYMIDGVEDYCAKKCKSTH